MFDFSIIISYLKNFLYAGKFEVETRVVFITRSYNEYQIFLTVPVEASSIFSIFSTLYFITDNIYFVY